MRRLRTRVERAQCLADTVQCGPFRAVRRQPVHAGWHIPVRLEERELQLSSAEPIAHVWLLPPPHPSSRFALRAVAAPKSPAPRAQGAEALCGTGDVVNERAKRPLARTRVSSDGYHASRRAAPALTVELEVLRRRENFDALTRACVRVHSQGSTRPHTCQVTLLRRRALKSALS